MQKQYPDSYLREQRAERVSNSLGEDEMADVRKHMIFHGRVQGVGFRYTAKYLARSMNLTGWVKNLTDGRVEAELQGQAEFVDSFVERISQRGRIVVEFVEEEDRELCYEEGFEVR